MGRLTKEQRDIYEWGEIERDAARAASFTPHGGWFYRFFRWCERVARENREEVQADVREAAAIRSLPGKEGA